MSVNVTIDNGVALLAPAGTDAAALADAIEGLAWDPSIRVAVIAIDGASGIAPAAEARDYLRLERASLPVVAALSGSLIGAPLDVALGCDIRIAEADAMLQFTSIGSRRMTALLGIDRQVALLESRLGCDAAGALEMGLVSAVSEPGGAAGLALATARTIASRGPVAVQLAKEAIWRGREMPLEQGLRFETDLTLLLQTTKDRAEGVGAFMEKRAPVFTGE